MPAKPRVGSILVEPTAVLGCLLLAGAASGQARYLYTGNNFADVQGSYTVADRVTGSFTVPTPMPAGSSYPTDISTQVASFAFSDGHQTLHDGNAILQVFLVGTDGGGNITSWAIEIWRAPIPTSLGALMDGIHTAAIGLLVQDVGYQDGLCLNVDSQTGLCDGVNLPTPEFGELFSSIGPELAGTWTSPIFRDGFEAGNVTSWSGSAP